MKRHHSWQIGFFASLALMCLVAGQRTEAGVTLVLDSEPGDWIGQGQRLSFTAADGDLLFHRASEGVMVVHFRSADFSHWWHLVFAAPAGQTLTVGTYTGATRPPFQAPGDPALEVSGNGRACNMLTGSFEVRQIAYDSNGGVESFSAAFEQHCEGAVPALLGEIRSNPFVTLTAPASRSLKTGGNVSFTVTAAEINCRPPTLTAVDLPLGATFNDNGNGTGTFSWTPAGGQTGMFYVRFEAYSDSGYMDSAATRITVNEDPIIIEPDVLTAAELFPAEAGDTWTYQHNVRKKLTITVLEEKKWINGIETRVFRDSHNSKEYYTADADGLRLHGTFTPSVAIPGGGRANMSVTFDPPLRLTNGVIEPGQTVASAGMVRSNPLPRVGTIEAAYSAVFTVDVLEVSTPAGAFDAVAVRGTLKISGQYDTLMGLFVAPGIGVVRSGSIQPPNSSNTLELIRTNVAPFTMNAASFPEGERGVAYNTSLDITPPGSPYTVSVVSGSLPAGLTIDHTGTINGVPSAKAKSTRFTVEVSEHGSYVAKTFSITIYKAIKVTNTRLQKGVTGKSYTTTLKVAGGKAPYTWSVISGSLPLGLAVNGATGSITGVPTQAGTFTAGFRVSDSLGGAAEKTFSLRVN
jgi:hypothetical protein